MLTHKTRVASKNTVAIRNPAVAVTHAKMDAVVRFDPLNHDLLTHSLGKRVNPRHADSITAVQEALPHSRVALGADVGSAQQTTFIF